MSKKWVLAGLVALALAVPAAASWAHEGHAHKVLGTITAVSANRVEMKTPEGKMVTVTVTAKTTYARGKQKVDATALKVGERIVAEVASEKDMIATSVTMPAAVPVAAR
jgi:hypothetical protein